MTTGSVSPDGSPPPDADDADDPEDRVPCPDGACIGVIGPDGRCSECGRAGEGAGTGQRLGLAEGEAEADDDELEGEADDDDLEGDDDEEERTPCPDGACIGIIGPNGRCSECGRSGETDGEPQP